MTEFGVNSEVGKLRKVMVHRPDLSLQRLTPSSHDALLFDDVLWVERAQLEHDRFVAQMRGRGVEVFLLHELLAETLAASEPARQRLIELVVSEYTVGLSLVDAVRELLGGFPPDVLAKHLIGGLTVAEAALDVETLAGSSLIAAALDDPSTFVLPPLPNTLFTRDSSCWIYGGVSVNPMFWPARRREAYNVAAIYKAHPMFADADFEFWYPHESADGRLETADFGLSSMEGGDVMPIGNGAVLIGMSERSQGRMIEQVAAALFEKGAADRVIACVMTKDRAHMHLDTVFTLLDRDKATAYPDRRQQHRCRQPPTGYERQAVPRDRGGQLPRRGGRRARGPEAARRRDGRRRLPAGARAVGRRQQRRRPRAGRRGGLRTQHLHDRQDAPGRGGSDRDRGIRARQGSRWRPLHDMSAAAGFDLMDAAKEAGVPEDTESSQDRGISTTRWILIAVVVIALVLFIAWARRNPPFDDRDPGPDDAAIALVVIAEGPDGGDV